MDGTPQSSFIENWIHAGAPAAIIAQDYSLMGDMYRQAEIEWNVTEAGDGYLTSKPIYFHGWFRLLGMLVYSGNFHAPDFMGKPKPNLRVYHQLDKTYMFNNDDLQISIDYRNYSSVAAANGVVTAVVPPEFDVVNANGGVVDGNTVTWNIGSVGAVTSSPVNTSGSVLLNVRAKDDINIGDYCFDVSVSCDGGDTYSSGDYPNNITEVMERNCVEIAKRALKISKTSDQDEYKPNDNAEYTIEFENSSDAGWLNGGRPGVTFSLDREYGNRMTLQLKMWHDAEEAYINYENYRVSLFFNDNTTNCLDGDPGCAVGWSVDNFIYEGGEVSGVQVSHEKITPGSDSRGSWNQRLIIQFSDQVATTTPHLEEYYGMGGRIHRGGTEQLKAKWDIYPSNYAVPDFSDDWSFGSSASNSELFTPLTPNWTDPDNLGTDVTTWHEHMCTLPTDNMDNVLIEEWDGHVWRRVMGNGPLPGRDIENVVIVDTLPLGLTFVGFTDDEALGQIATHKNVGGRDIITWTTTKLQVQQVGTISYIAKVAFPSGASCDSPNEEIINTSWISGDGESPKADQDTVTVTCDEPEVCPKEIGLNLTSDVSKHKMGDDIEYTYAYTQTTGTTVDNPPASEWMKSHGSKMGTSGLKINFEGQGKSAVHKYSHGTDGFVTFRLNIDQYADGNYAILRADGNNYIAVNFKQEYSDIDIKVYEYTNGASTQLGDAKYTIPFSPGDLDVKLEVIGGTLKIWVVDLTTPNASITIPGFTVRSGYAGFAHDDYNAGGSATNWHSEFDSGFDIELKATVPTQIINATSTTGNVNGSEVTWSIASGDTPFEAGSTFEGKWTGEVNECVDIFHYGHINMKGVDTDEFGDCITTSEDCGTPPCTAPKTTSITGTVDVCEGSPLSLTGAHTGTATLDKYYYSWHNGSSFDTPTAANTTFDIANVQASDHGKVIKLRIEDGNNGDNACYKEESVTLKVTPSVTSTVVLAATSSTTICAGGEVIFDTTSTTGFDGTASYAYIINNGTLQSVTSLPFSVPGLTNGDKVSLRATGAIGCASSANTTSNKVTINVTTAIDPEVVLSATSSSTICSGGDVTFDTTSTTGFDGSATYAYLINGITPTSVTSLPFTVSGLTDGEKVSLEVSGATGCVSASSATSSEVSVNVTTAIDPEVVLSATTSSTICAGGDVTFDTTSTTGFDGSATYSYLVNGLTPTAVTSLPFTVSGLTDGDKVTLEVSGATGCVSESSVTSSEITVNVTAAIDPEVVLSSSSTTICAGGEVSFDTISTNAFDGSAIYGYMINSGTVNAIGAFPFTVSALADGDKVSVIATDAVGCVSGSSAESNEIEITIDAAPQVPIVIGVNNEDTVCTNSALDLVTTGRMSVWYENDVEVAYGDRYMVTVPSGGIKVSVADSVTCGLSTPLDINLNAVDAPTIGQIVGTMEACKSSPELYTATGFENSDTYNWSINGAVITSENLDQVTLDFSGSSSSATLRVSGENDFCGAGLAVESVITLVGSLPEISVSLEQLDSLCNGEIGTVTFKATPIGGGANPTYDWGDGNFVSADEFTASGLSSGDDFSVIMQTSSTCVGSLDATPQGDIVVVGKLITVTDVSIISSETEICEGESITFDINNTTNEGNSPVYAWFINGEDQGESGVSYTTDILKEGDKVNATMTVAEACVQDQMVSSNEITPLFKTQLDPQVTIATLGGITEICTDGEITFQIETVADSGATPSFDWFIDNTSQSVNAQTFTTTTLTDGQVVSAKMVVSESCTVIPEIASNAIPISVVTSLEPKVTVRALTPTSAICENDLVELEIETTVGDGDNTTFDWLINDGTSSQTGTQFSSTSLKNGDKITVKMENLSACADAADAVSTEIDITVGLPVTPTVSIKADVLSACLGTDLTFEVDQTANEGGDPSYEWFVNELPINGETGTSFITDELQKDDTVTVKMTVIETCVTDQEVISAAIAPVLSLPLDPSISTYNTSLRPIFCAGESITFNTVKSDSGDAPTYQWFVNNLRIDGQVGNTFTSTTLKDDDQVTVEMTINEDCNVNKTVPSNMLQMNILNPSVEIEGINIDVCDDESVFIQEKNPSDLGDTPHYLWYINGEELYYTDKLLSKKLDNGDVVLLKLKVDECELADTVVTSPITVRVSETDTLKFDFEVIESANMCEGDEITFNITDTVNAGKAPEFTWIIGSKTIKSSEMSQTADWMKDGDNVNVKMEVHDLKCPFNIISDPVIKVVALTPSVTPKVAVVASNTSLCEGQDVTFTINAKEHEGSSPTYKWFVDGDLVQTDGEEYFLENIEEDVTVNVSMDVSADVTCVTSSDVSSNNVNINVTQDLIPTVSVSLAKDTFCLGQEVIVYGERLPNMSAYQFVWTKNGIASNDISSTYSDNDFEKLDELTVALTYPTCLGSVGTTDPIVVEVPMIDVPMPKLTYGGEAIIGERTVKLCQGESFAFGFDDVKGGVSWEAPDVNEIDVEEANLNHSGDYTYVLSHEICGNVPSSGTVTLEVYTLPEVTLTMSSGLPVRENNPANYVYFEDEDKLLYVNGNNLEDVTYDWSQSMLTPDELDRTNSGASFQTNAELGDWYFEVAAINKDYPKCYDIDTAWMNVVSHVIPPTAFTPNGDGVNDTWMIPGMEKYPDAKVQIYNRWGQLVFTTTGFYLSNPWDGKGAGDVVTFGTYYVVIELNDPDNPEPIMTVVTVMD